MKSFAILCFLLLASACIFAVRAEEETTDVDAPKVDEQPELAANSDEEAPETTDDEEDEEDEEDNQADEETKGDEEDNQADEETKGDEEEEDENDEEGEELDADEQEKRGLTSYGPRKCFKWRYGRLSCIRCGCRRVCRIKYCRRRVCRRYRCGYKNVCHWSTRYRIVKRRVKVNVGSIYYPRYIWKWIIKRVPYRVRVCRKVPKFCTKCFWKRFPCGKICRNVCKYKKCVPYYVHRG